MEETDGGTLRHQFDEQQRPVVQFFGVGPERLTLLWVDAAGRAVTVGPDQLRVESGSSLLRAMTGTPTYGVGRLELRLANDAVAEWDVRWDRPPETRPAVAELAALRVRDADAAVRRADALLAAGAADRSWIAVERARAVGTAGNHAAAVAALRTAAAVAEEARLPSEVSRCTRAAAAEAMRGRDYLTAEPLLMQSLVIDRRIGNSLGILRAVHYRGRLEFETGRFREATADFEATVRDALAQGADDDASQATQSLALVLQEQGSHQAAVSAIERARPMATASAASPARRAFFLTHFVWVRLRAIVAGALPPDFASVSIASEEAVRIRKSLGQRAEAANDVANLAWIAERQGRLDDARRLIAESRALRGGSRGVESVFLDLLEAELLLRAGSPAAARTAYAAALVSTRQEAPGGVSDSIWRARLGLGRAELAAGHRPAALAHLREAFATLTRLGARTLINEGRAGFFQDRRELIDELLAALLTGPTGGSPVPADVDEAFGIADAAQAQTLRALESAVRLDRLSPAQREDWQRRAADYLRTRDSLEAATRAAGVEKPEVAAKRLAKLAGQASGAFDRAYALLDEVAPLGVPDATRAAPLAGSLAPDEGLYLATTLRGEPLAFFVSGGGGATEVRRGPSARLEAWVAELPAASPLRHLYLIPGTAEDPAAAVPLLLDRLSVSVLPHAGFLLRPETPSRAGGGGQPPPPASRATPAGDGMVVGPGTHGLSGTRPPLVVADPTGDLPHALVEGDAVAARLPGALVLRGDAATRPAVLSALDGAPAFYFAGHGIVRPEQPWDAHLRLAEGEALSLADLLVARPRVGVAILSGCRSGARGSLGRFEAVGLPEAFLAAGARTVLATHRPVEDAGVGRFMRLFFDHGGAEHPALAHRQAALALRTSGDPIWSAFFVAGRRY